MFSIIPVRQGQLLKQDKIPIKISLTGENPIHTAALDLHLVLVGSLAFNGSAISPALELLLF